MGEASPQIPVFTPRQFVPAVIGSEAPSLTAYGSQRAGSIQLAAAGQHLEFTIAKEPLPKPTQVPLWFELLLNSIFSAEVRYGTLVQPDHRLVAHQRLVCHRP
jgi:hypothetical protein